MSAGNDIVCKKCLYDRIAVLFLCTYVIKMFPCDDLAVIPHLLDIFV